MHRIAACLLGALAASSAGAATAPCEQADDSRACYLEALQKVERTLESRFNDVFERLENRRRSSGDVIDESHQSSRWYLQRIANLNRAQSAWRTYRDVTCEAKGDRLGEADSDAGFAVRHRCLIELARARIEQLREVYGPSDD